MQQQTLIGVSPAFSSVLDKVSRLAPIDRPVLITGERGTGKELIAQRLHYLSSRWDQPLISLNCSSLSGGLIDSELFGHEAGAFTGSKGRHQGRFERAEGGSLFLDELATSPLSVQEKLLRVIEYGQYERVGGSKTLNADVRLICATNANLPHMASQNTFRADLLDRLAFDVIHLPPLRHRKEDIPLLAEHYAMKMCRELSRLMFNGFSEHAMAQLLDYAWPGNVRELKNVVERAVYQHVDETAAIDHLVFNPFESGWVESSDAGSNHSLSEEVSQDKASAVKTPVTNEPNYQLPMDYKQWQENEDRKLLNHVMEKAKFNQKTAANMLNLSYHQLRGMLRKYDLIGTIPNKA